MTRSSATVAAIDLGASSGRVLVGRFGGEGASLHEVHRFRNRPTRVAGVLRWDLPALLQGVLDGLRRAEQHAGPLDSIGVDSWAVDYGTLDPDGVPGANPVHYRNGDTAEAIASVHRTLGAEGLFTASGVQHLPFNTVFQLVARRPAGEQLLIADLVNAWLCGVRGTDITNASTTGLVDPRTRGWSAPVLDALGLGRPFPPLHEPGAVLGPVRADRLRAAGLSGRPVVVAVPSHDTAAAVAGVPATGRDFAFVCTGTWALAGVELAAPVLTPAARTANFSNELGTGATVRFLRNVTGLWLLQECVREWSAGDAEVDLAGLLASAAATGPGTVIDVQDAAFLDPGDMPHRIAAAARRGSGQLLSSRAEIVRCILDSVAIEIGRAVEQAVELSGHRADVVHVVGGGVANPLFCQLIADAVRRPVRAGPVEATAWGNAVTQAQTLGAVPPTLATARALIARASPPARYQPAAVRWSAS